MRQQKGIRRTHVKLIGKNLTVLQITVKKDTGTYPHI